MSDARDYINRDLQDFLLAEKASFDSRFEAKSVKTNIDLEEFTLMRTIGTGTFSHVVLAKLNSLNSFHAIKIMEKEKIVGMKAISYILNEKRVLESINFPFCVYLSHSFKDTNNLYLSMPFINGGELYLHLRQRQRFNEKTASFYAAQVVLCLEYLHCMGLVYRDLKPENILLDSLGFIRLTDFGFCKRVRGRTYTFCGTPEYIAPEVIQNKGYGEAVDWWSLGVLTFELNTGYTPFQADSPLKLYEDITFCKYTSPPEFSKELTSFVSSLIEKDLSRRFGTLKNGVNDIKSHAWFHHINWAALLGKTEEPPFSPTTKGRGDASNFAQYDEPNIEIATNDKDPYVHYFEDF